MQQRCRFRTWWIQLTAIVIVICGQFVGQFAFGEETRPNILVAIADDWGYPHASVYGDPIVATPNFDRLAAEGVLFIHAFVSSPSCTPSRGAILSGQHFWRLGEGANLHSTLDRSIPVYTDLLEEAGYHVGFTRKGWGPGQAGRGGRTTNPAGLRFNSFSDFLKARPQRAPFCFWFGSTDPHRSYDPELRETLGVDPDAVVPPAIFPNVPAVREDLADYYAEVRRFDTELGQLVDELEALGELGNTIIVITGDHGMPFPRCKGNLYDSGTRVPLAIVWKGTFSGGRRIDDFVSLTDLAPTFLEAAGAEVPALMTGRSLLPILRGEAEGQVEPARDHVLTGRERHTPSQEAPISGGYPMRAIRTSEFLYIWNLKPDRWPGGTPVHARAYFENGWLGDTDNGPTKLYLFANRDDPQVRPLYDLAFARRSAEELYDLRVDPNQVTNVVGDLRYSETLVSLRKRLHEELERTADPRVIGGGEAFDTYPYSGKIPSWPGEETLRFYRN